MNPHQVLYDYIQALSPLAQEEWDRIRSAFKLVNVKRKQFLLREGEVCHDLYFVVEGSLRMYLIHTDGQELVRYFAFEKKFGTNLTSLIEGSPSVEYIQAIEPTTLLKISKSDFFRLVDTVPQINAVYRNILENAYITSQKRIYKLQGMSALDRLKWLNSNFPGILVRIPSRMIASYLGITPFTLSRLKGEL